MKPSLREMRLWAVFGSKVSTVPSVMDKNKIIIHKKKNMVAIIIIGKYSCYTHILTFQ